MGSPRQPLLYNVATQSISAVQIEICEGHTPFPLQWGTTSQSPLTVWQCLSMGLFGSSIGCSSDTLQSLPWRSIVEGPLQHEFNHIIIAVSLPEKTRIVEGPLLCEAAVEGGQNPSPSKWLIFIIYLIKFKQEKTHLVNCQSFRGFFPSGPTLFKSIFVYLSQSTSTFNHSWC